MHPKIRQAIEEIDAAVFNGDTFAEKDAHDRLTAHAEEWLRELKHEGVVARAFALGRRFSGVSVECRRDERQWPHPCRAYVVTSKAQRQEYAEAVYADTPELACAALLEQTAKLDAEARGVSVPLGKSQAASMAPEHQPKTGSVVHVARGSVAYTDGIAEHVPYATPIDGSAPACIDEQGRTVRDILRERRSTFEQLYPEVGWRMAIIRAGQSTSPQQKRHAARWLLQQGIDDRAPELADEIRAAFQPPRYDAAKVEASFTPKGGQPVRFVGMTVETCWKCGRDVKFGIRHGEHQCDRVFLEERLRSFVGHVVNQMMVSGEKVTIDPVTLGEVAGRVAKMYVDGSDREYPKVEIDCDAMLRAMGRIRVTVWFTKRAPDDHTYDVAVVYPRMNGVE